MLKKYKDILLDPIFNNNPIALQILGICSALAVTSKLIKSPSIVAGAIALGVQLHDGPLRE